MSGGFFRGTSAEQDNRFSNKDKKLLNKLKYEDVLATKVDLDKVKLDVLKPWVSEAISKILGFEDEIVIDLVFNMLEEAKKNTKRGKPVDPKMLQLNLTGFLKARPAREFMGELWAMMVSAQEQPSGIPEQLIEAKKREMQERQLETDRIANAIRQQKQQMQEQMAGGGASKRTRPSRFDSGPLPAPTSVDRDPSDDEGRKKHKKHKKHKKSRRSDEHGRPSADAAPQEEEEELRLARQRAMEAQKVVEGGKTPPADADR